MADNKQETSTDDVPGPKAIFRIPRTAYFAIWFLIFCMTPIALGEIHWLAVIYLIPIVLLVFVRRTQTVADAEGIKVRTMFGHRELPWSALKGLALTKKSKVLAVLADDTRIPLPTVRTRHLPVLSVVSAGRLEDPSGLTTEPAPESARTTADPRASLAE